MRSIRCDTAQGKQMWILEWKFRVSTSLSGFSRKAIYWHGTSVEAQLFPWQINTHASNVGVGNGVRNGSIASSQVIYNYSYLNHTNPYFRLKPRLPKDPGDQQVKKSKYTYALTNIAQRLLPRQI